MGARLSTTFERSAEPARTASVWPASGWPARCILPAGAVTGLFLGLVAVVLATASPAAAVDDPTRPDAAVTRGPSCRPGGLVVEIVAGTTAYTVRLATSRRPEGEDEVTLAPQAAASLQTGDVEPGETIDPRLEFTPLDGAGAPFVDELTGFTLTRPTPEDCEAVLAPPAPAPTEPTATVHPPSPSPAQDPGPASDGRTPSAPPSGPAGTAAPGPAAGTPPRTSEQALPPVDRPGPAGPQQVTAGSTVVLRGAGFLPGEQVDIRLHGTGTLLATATAGSDGQVRVDVRIPGGATAGPAVLDLVGADSDVVTGVRLRVAADRATAEPAGDARSPVPLVAAAGALVGTSGGLLSVAGRQRAHRRRRDLLRAA